METKEISVRVVAHRKQLGLTQEQVAEKSGLNLRTVQRIEKGETVPRGDSLRRLAGALCTSPDDLIDWQLRDDRSMLTILSLSQLTFFAFPILGIVVPLIIWISQKDKVRGVEEAGRSILNFQISWTLALFVCWSVVGAGILLPTQSRSLITPALPTIGVLYAYNLVIILLNTVFLNRNGKRFYMPAIRFLG